MLLRDGIGLDMSRFHGIPLRNTLHVIVSVFCILLHFPPLYFTLRLSDFGILSSHLGYLFCSVSLVICILSFHFWSFVLLCLCFSR